MLDAKTLTKEEKITLVMGADFWSNDDLGGKLPKFIVSDGPVGLRQPVDRTDPDQKECIRSVAYPSIQMLANTWDPDLAYRMGRSLGNDCIEQNVDILLAPGVNIKRRPTCGRNFEYFSEDPYLAGAMAKAYIQGVQDMHVGTCLKHFCCNNAEYSRHWATMEVDERTLREIYLRVFQIALEAKPWSVMCAYNGVNGQRMSEHKKLYKVLSQELGFDGTIISDWDAVKDPVASVNAGLHLTMPHDKIKMQILRERMAELDEDMLTACAQKVIDLAETCASQRPLRKQDMTLEDRRALAQKIQEEAIVLLKNNGVLPLAGEDIFVTGAPAFRYYYGDGSSHVHPERAFEPLVEALRAEGAEAIYRESIWEIRGHQSHVGNIKEAAAWAARAKCTVLCVGDPNTCEDESWDRAQIRLTKEEELAIRAMRKASDKLVVVVYAGAAIDMSDWQDLPDAIVWAGYGGEYGNRALARVLLGKVNPSGKLSETFPVHLEDVPAENAYRDESVMVYSEGLNVGYRYFDSFGVPVLYPFGHGLSYSDFVYENLTLTPTGDGAEVAFDIRNVSCRDGAEVAQVYVRELCREVYRPDRELKAWQKVFVPAGESRRVTLALPRQAFAYWSEARDSWRVQPGMFKILVGASSRDVRLSGKVEIL